MAYPMVVSTPQLFSEIVFTIVSTPASPVSDQPKVSGSCGDLPSAWHHIRQLTNPVAPLSGGSAQLMKML
jgi:hypothetical protein